MGTATDPFSRHPKSAMIHSGRFSLQNTTFVGLSDSCGLEARGKRERRGGGLAVRVGQRPVSVVVDEGNRRARWQKSSKKIE